MSAARVLAELVASARPDVAADMVTLLRRDWAVRVLDAWRTCSTGLARAVWLTGHRGCCILRTSCYATGEPETERVFEGRADAARLAAAEAAWLELPESVRTEVGEQP